MIWTCGFVIGVLVGVLLSKFKTETYNNIQLGGKVTVGEQGVIIVGDPEHSVDIYKVDFGIEFSVMNGNDSLVITVGEGQSPKLADKLMEISV